MPAGQRQPWDVLLTVGADTTGLVLVRDDRGKRMVRRTKIAKPEIAESIGDTQRGESGNEIVIELVPAQDAGFGEGRRKRAGWYAYTRNADARWGQVMLAPLVTAVSAPALVAGAPPRQFYELATNSSEIYLLWGRYVLAFNTTTPSTNRNAKDLGSGVQATQAANFDGYAFIASYTTTGGVAAVLQRHSYASPTDTFDAGAAGTNYDGFAQAPHSVGSVLYGTRYVSSLTRMDRLDSGSDGTLAASWTDNINIGDAGERYRWLATYGYGIYAASPVGFWRYDENLNSVNAISQLSMFRTADNGKGTVMWNSALWIPHVRGIYATNGGETIDAGPIQGTTLRQDDSSRRFGYPVALCPTDEWLIASLWNGTDTYLFLGSDATGEMIWHPWIYISGQGPFTAMAVTGQVTPPRVFIAQESATNTVYYFDLPRADNPLQDPQPFAASGSWISSFCTGGMPGVNKVLEEFVVTGDSLSANETLTIKFRTNETDSWTAITGAVTTTLTTKRPAATATGEGIQVWADLARGGTTTLTPVLRSLTATMLAAPRQAQVWTFTVLVEDNQEDSWGHPDSATAAGKLAAIIALSRTTPFTFSLNGTDYTVVLMDKVEWEELYRDGQEDPAYLVTFRVREFGGT